MQATGTVQMNTRIDASLKDAGDRVLSVLGYSPSRAVRALWEFVVAHQDQPEAITGLLEHPAGDVSEDAALREKLGALEAGRMLCTRLGDLSAEVADAPYDDLRQAAYAERYNQSL